MAEELHTASRRGMLGLLAAAPVMIAAPAVAAGSVDAVWRSVEADYQTARTARDAYIAGPYQRAADEFDQVRDRWPMNYFVANDPVAAPIVAAASAKLQPYEDRLSELNRAESLALVAMLRAPAPTAAALAAKLELAADAEVNFIDLDDAQEFIACMARDARRLAAH